MIAAGLEGLLAPTPAVLQDAPRQAAPERTKGNYKTVCYSIAPELAEKMRYIAYWDRKKINAVVSEAFAAYCENWKPSTGGKPKKI